MPYYDIVVSIFFLIVLRGIPKIEQTSINHGKPKYVEGVGFRDFIATTEKSMETAVVH